MGGRPGNKHAHTNAYAKCETWHLPSVPKHVAKCAKIVQIQRASSYRPKEFYLDSKSFIYIWNCTVKPLAMLTTSSSPSPSSSTRTATRKRVACFWNVGQRKIDQTITRSTDRMAREFAFSFRRHNWDLV